MLPCNKRQKIVKRPSGDTSYRCLHKKSGVHGQTVDEGVCSRCPLRSVPHVKPCDKVNIVTSEEMISLDDEEVKKMISEAGLDIMDLDENPLIEKGPLPPEYPPLSVQLWTYKEALIKWNKAGRPTRSQEEVEEIHKTHCMPCEWYDKEKKRCRGCGCTVSVGSIAVLNKIKMGTEHCPKEKW